jgi:hypothetical protein
MFNVDINVVLAYRTGAVKAQIGASFHEVLGVWFRELRHFPHKNRITAHVKLILGEREPLFNFFSRACVFFVSVRRRNYCVHPRCGYDNRGNTHD